MFISWLVLIPLICLACVGIIVIEYAARCSCRSLLGWVNTYDDSYAITTWYVLCVRIFEIRKVHSSGVFE